jgi:hypothetical protein
MLIIFLLFWSEEALERATKEEICDFCGKSNAIGTGIMLFMQTRDNDGRLAWSE